MRYAGGLKLNSRPQSAKTANVKALAETCFDDIPTEGPVIVAVSGGSDSLALLLLANIWARKNKINLQAVTVDHGLRPEAAAEAAFVSGVCAGIDVPHVTLAWDGLKPSFGIQEAARQSRYSLMDDFAHEIGADVILAGHTLDDQAETVQMRINRTGAEGDGRGLAGMGRLTWFYGGTRLIRPLLGVSRQALRDFLSDYSQSWIEDPSNLDESYERVRVRRQLADDRVRADGLIRFAEVCSRMRGQLARQVADFLKERGKVLPGPVYTLDLSASKSAVLNGAAKGGRYPDPVEAHAIQVLLAMAGGQPQLVSQKRLQPVLEMVANGGNEAGRYTIGGAVIEVSGALMKFYREVRNLGSLMLEPGETAIWDGRMHVSNETAMAIFIEPASRQQIREFEAQRGTPWRVKPRQALWSTPIIHHQSQGGPSEPCLPLVDASPLMKGLEVRLACPAIEHFCPESDAPLCDWIRELDQYPAASLQP
jgi:tRNA(Ile)-lysidine synthase